MRRRRGLVGLLLLGSLAGAAACADDSAPSIPAVLMTNPGPWLEGTTFFANVSVVDSSLRVVSTDPGVVEVLSSSIEPQTDTSCIPFCSGYGGGVHVRAAAVGTADLQLLDDEGNLLDTQIIGVARPDRIELVTVVGSSELGGLGIGLGGETIDGDRMVVAANQLFEIEARVSAGSTDLLGGELVGDVDGGPTCAFVPSNRAVARIPPLTAGAHEVALRIGTFERHLDVEAVALDAVSSLEIVPASATSIFGGGAPGALRAIARDAAGEPIHFVRDVTWESTTLGAFSTALELGEGSTLIDSDSLSGIAPTQMVRLRAFIGETSTESEVLFGAAIPVDSLVDLPVCN